VTRRQFHWGMKMTNGGSSTKTWRSKLIGLVAAIGTSLALTSAGSAPATAAVQPTSPEPIGAQTKTTLKKLVFRRSGQGLRIADHTSHASHSSHASHYSSRHS